MIITLLKDWRHINVFGFRYGRKFVSGLYLQMMNLIFLPVIQRKERNSCFSFLFYPAALFDSRQWWRTITNYKYY